VFLLSNESRENEIMKTAKIGLRVAIVTGLLAVTPYANATENAQERRDARDVKQGSR
jgi:hypothetical protein